MRRALLVLGAVAALLTAAILPAAAAGLATRPVIVNPCGPAAPTPGDTSQWEANQGTKDDLDHYGLHLQKVTTNTADNCPVPAVTFNGENGKVLSKLAFSIRDDSTCSGGVPRWNIRTTGRNLYWAFCEDGTKSPDPLPTPTGVPAFTKVVWGDGQIVPVCHIDASFENCDGPADPWPGFGNVTIRSLDIITDSPSNIYLDNIRINGKVFRRPGGPS
jgi:hypothetical protein